MSSQTLLSIIEEIETTSIRKKSTDSESGSKIKWTKDDQKIILEVIVQYGEDLSLIHSFFPTLTRKQLKRKVKEISEKKRSQILRIEQRAERQRRKSFFDQEILDEDRKSGTEESD